MHLSEPVTRLDVFAWSDALVDRWCAASPLAATFAGVPGHDHRWDDFGPDGIAARAAFWRGVCAELDAQSPAPDAVAPAQVLRDHAEAAAAYWTSDDPWYDLNNITSTFQMVSMAFDALPDAAAGREAARARLNGLPDALAAWRDTLRHGIQTGRTVAGTQVRAVLAQGEAQSLGPTARFVQLGDRFGDPTAGRAAQAAVADTLTWLRRDYLPHARAEEGVGAERYARCARRFLGCDLDPHEAYAWGWSEIRTIDAAIASLLPDLGATHVGAAIAALGAHDLEIPAFVDAIRNLQARAIARLDGVHFDIPPAVRAIDVQVAPPGSKAGAWYLAPSEDGSRPGTIWYAPGRRTRMPLWSEVTTAWHEGFPGHHLQIATALVNRDDLTRFHRLFGECSGYAEGWALYAEALMHELGFLDGPAQALGMHLGQLARAWRVVVDIGLHLDLPIPRDADFHPGERWTPALAEAAMRDRAGLTPEVAASEVVRYLGWPGQAISYKLGQRALLQLRDARRHRDGAAFDSRAFHRDILATGQVGLSRLRARVLGA